VEWLHYLIDYGIIGILIMMSVIAVAVAIERRTFYRKVEISAYADKRCWSCSLPGGSISLPP
jgi:biopolymer transport protein ExbB